MSKADILRIVEEQGIELVRFLYIDNDGVTRGYSAHRNSLEGDLDSGHAFARVMPVFSALDTLVPGSRYGCVGEVRGKPDLDTFRILPYAPGAAALICDFTDLNHKPLELCARSVLKRVLAGSPYRVNACYENEFYFMKTGDSGEVLPFDSSLCFATPGMNNTHEVVLEITRALESQGMVVEKHYPEYGPGQQELIIRYDEALRAADNQVFFKETVKGVASKHGIKASFMPKPFPGRAGSGAHLHVSLWDGDTNLFYDPARDFNLSEMARYFTGGVLKHIRGLCAFTASIVTSYKRLVPHNWASAYACYGPDNREAAVRVVSGQKGRENKTVNLEFKPIDGACNPYLALAALLVAGFDGIENRIDPGDPTLTDPHDLTGQEKEERGIRRLPETLAEAARALSEDPLFSEKMGDVLVEEYVLAKVFQWNEYNSQITPWEVQHYAEVF
ncbi:MAG: glutamine synthetase family protein [Bacillota bacterium]